GLVSRSGVLALSWSLDHVGPMTRGVWDSAVMLQAIAGADPDDTSTRGVPTQDYVQHLEDGARGLRLGLLKRYYVDGPGLNEEVRGLPDHGIRGRADPLHGAVEPARPARRRRAVRLQPRGTAGFHPDRRPPLRRRDRAAPRARLRARHRLASPPSRSRALEAV